MKSLLAVAATAACACGAQAGIVTINFDVDAKGNPINAPSVFIETTALDTLYESLGIVFMGPAENDGGGILHQDGNFGVPARSGTNFLAFNRFANYSDGGIPRDPETLLFSTPVQFVSIWAAGGFDSNRFLMEAFDTAGNLVASDTVTTRNYAELRVDHAPGIARVVLTELGGGDSFWVYDDLSYQFIPAPGAAAIFGAMMLGVGRRRRT